MLLLRWLSLVAWSFVIGPTLQGGLKALNSPLGTLRSFDRPLPHFPSLPPFVPLLLPSPCPIRPLERRAGRRGGIARQRAQISGDLNEATGSLRTRPKRLAWRRREVQPPTLNMIVPIRITISYANLKFDIRVPLSKVSAY